MLKMSVNDLQYDHDPSRCTAICGQLLSCGHACTFTCGQCSQLTDSTEDALAEALGATRISESPRKSGARDRHLACVVICGKALACGHACSKKCHPTTEPCALCFRKCPVSCEHSKCPARCLEVWQCVFGAYVPGHLPWLHLAFRGLITLSGKAIRHAACFDDCF